jgi:hypothetical protein
LLHQESVSRPTAVLFEPVVRLESVLRPMAVLLPDIFEKKRTSTTAVLELPIVVKKIKY